MPLIGTSLEASTSRALSPDGIPLKFAAGWNSSSAARDSTRALVSLTTAEIAVQLAPLSVE